MNILYKLTVDLLKKADFPRQPQKNICDVIKQNKSELSNTDFKI